MIPEINSKEVKEVIDLFNLGKLKTAENLAKQLINRFPDSAILFNLMGAILSSQKKYDEAIKNFKESLKINPNNAEAENFNAAGAGFWSEPLEGDESVELTMAENQSFTISYQDNGGNPVFVTNPILI